MIKLVVFDLDNTLAFHGEGITPKTLAELRKIEDMVINVAICSGKTAFYLSGFLRQVELKNPIIIRKNGAELQFGVNTPPEIYNIMQIPAKKLKKLAWVKKKINKLFNNQIWFQHNRFAVSPFLNTTAEFEIVENFIIKHKRKLKVLLFEKFNNIDYSNAKEDVLPFIKDKSKLDIWSKEFFIDITKNLKGKQ